MCNEMKKEEEELRPQSPMACDLTVLQASCTAFRCEMSSLKRMGASRDTIDRMTIIR